MTRRRTDRARMIAFRVLRAVSAEGAYANLELSQRLAEAGLEARDAALATELVAGTCRSQGSYDAIIEAAAGRPLKSLQPAVVDALRLGTHQLLDLRIPLHAAVSATVDVAAVAISERVAGVVNAVLRKVGARTFEEWMDVLTAGMPPADALALRSRHPSWIVAALADVLPADELSAALDADNRAPTTHLVVRPGLAEVSELGGEPTRYSPWGAVAAGDPGRLRAVRESRAGVQDEGSQLVTLALARADAPEGPWLDTCAGPGGKAALLAGLARQQGRPFIAAELQPHRAALVAQALRGYPEPRPTVLVADGTRPPWREGRFAKVLLDAPCTGLGALRRRPESRWRRSPDDVADLVVLQRLLLRAAIRATRPGGIVAYVTCSPHRAETVDVVDAVVADGDVDIVEAAALLPEVPDAARGPFVQLWPHRHGTDAMFLAVLRRR